MKNGLIWSAGIGLQQQIPVASKKLSGYGFNGNNNIFNDYIPSIYLRLEKSKKWFIQTEFSYGSPRIVAEFPYSRKTELNNTSTKISTTLLHLKKLFTMKFQ